MRVNTFLSILGAFGSIISVKFNFNDELNDEGIPLWLLLRVCMRAFQYKFLSWLIDYCICHQINKKKFIIKLWNRVRCQITILKLNSENLITILIFNKSTIFNRTHVYYLPWISKNHFIHCFLPFSLFFSFSHSFCTEIPRGSESLNMYKYLLFKILTKKNKSTLVYFRHSSVTSSILYIYFSYFIRFVFSSSFVSVCISLQRYGIFLSISFSVFSSFFILFWT